MGDNAETLSLDQLQYVLTEQQAAMGKVQKMMTAVTWEKKYLMFVENETNERRSTLYDLHGKDKRYSVYSVLSRCSVRGMFAKRYEEMSCVRCSSCFASQNFYVAFIKSTINY